MKKKNALNVLAIVALGILTLACNSKHLVGGYSVVPGMKIQIRSGGPFSGGADVGSGSLYNPVRDSVSNPISTPISMTESEELIKKVLLKSEQAWNEKDTKVYLNLFSEDARIMVGREQKIVSKAIYAKMFPAAFDEAGTVKYESLSVKILNAKIAKAKGVASISADKGIIWLTKELRLVNHNNKWLISESTFVIYFKGDTDPRDRSRPQLRGETPS